MTLKARVIIVSILLIAALSIALREHISWEQLAAYIGISTPPVSAPADTNSCLPSAQSIDSTALTPLACTEITLAEPANSPASSQTDEPQIIPAFDVIEQVLATDHNAKKSATAPAKKSRTRRRKKTPAQETTVEIAPRAPEPHKAIEQPVAQAPTIEIAGTEKTETLQTAAQPKKIRIHNKINVKELAVKHWTGTYSPTKLEITLNGIPFTIVGKEAIDLHAAYEVPHAESRIVAEYSYEFLNGMRKGSDTITYTITENAPEIELHFSWDTPWHVELNGAQRVE